LCRNFSWTVCATPFAILISFSVADPEPELLLQEVYCTGAGEQVKPQHLPDPFYAAISALCTAIPRRRDSSRPLGSDFFNRQSKIFHAA
jgi:hypothetical protein